MAVQPASSSPSPVPPAQQRPAVQQTQATSETADNQDRAAQKANETRQAEPAPKPVLNLQGQSIGGTLNTTA